MLKLPRIFYVFAMKRVLKLDLWIYLILRFGQHAGEAGFKYGLNCLRDLIFVL